MNSDAIQAYETRLLLEMMQHHFGYDFRNYADASLKRQLQRCLSVFQCPYISSLIPRLLHEQHFLEHLVHELTVGVTSMFRDPTLYHVLRNQVLPDLMTYPFLNVWTAGCSTGEEVYSMAIFLQEAGLYDRARIYATDLDNRAILVAQKGIYPASKSDEYSNHYAQAGGSRTLADYYTIKNNQIHIDPTLRKNMVFATHNLATDSPFADMHLIFCRNVLIYFAPPLQDRALTVFRESLVRGGIFCLGSQEFLPSSDETKHFAVVSKEERVFQKRFAPDLR